MSGVNKYPVKSYSQRIGNDSVYGQGTDGTVIISNTNTPTVLIRDMYYDNLTINANCTLITNGFRLFVKNTLTNNGTIGSTLGYTTPITDGTISGQGSGTQTYSLSQTSQNTVALTILEDLNIAIKGYYVDNAGTARVLRGGDKGSDGTDGSGAGAGGTGSAGTTGSDGTGATAGHANAGGAGAAATLPGNWHYAHGTTPHVYYNWSTQAGSGNPGNPGHANAGTNGVAGPAGAAGNAGNPGTSGTKGIGGYGGPVVLIVAKNITGSGSVINVGQSGSSGNAGAAGNAGTGATNAPSTWPSQNGTAGNATNGTAGNTGTDGHVYVNAHDSGYHNPGNPYGSNANYHVYFHVGPGSHMRTYGGTAGRPANESNAAHFPQHAFRQNSPAFNFHWSGAPSNHSWPRGSNPANIAHFNINLGHHSSAISGYNPNTGHNATSNAHNTAHYHVQGGGAGGNAGNAAAGAAGNAGNAGNPGNNGTAGTAGNPGNAGAAGKEGAIVVITDNWGLSQTLSSSTKIILNS